MTKIEWINCPHCGKRIPIRELDIKQEQWVGVLFSTISEVPNLELVKE